LRKLVERKVIRSHERVVVISTANGLKFAEQKIAYHAGTLAGVHPGHQNRPVELTADPKQIAATISHYVERMRLLEA
jgi:threonine synthase